MPKTDKIDAKAEPKTKTKLVAPKPKTKLAAAEPKAKLKTKPESKAPLEPKTKPAAKAKPAAPEHKVEHKAEHKAEHKSEHKSEHKAEPEVLSNGFAHLGLSKAVLKALAACEYKKPTPIQEEAIPMVMAGEDIIAKAPTGTGKTAVFVLPALERILVAKTRIKPRILILAPTRELATQITDVIYKFGREMKELGINATSILGGMPYREQLRKLSRPQDIIIATPGRLIDYMKRGDLDFSNIEMLVLDEADRMLDMGFIDDVKYIADATPKGRQTLLFTATLDGKLVKLAGNILKSPQHVEVEHKKETLDNISQRLYVADNQEHKTRLLKYLLENESVYKAIIFSATKRNADDLAKQLRVMGYSVAALHGDMRQHKRNTTITQFKAGRVELLIATDVAARGIDVDDISHVFNYDLSKFAEDHIHRIGRTGRAGKKGTAISLALPSDGANLQKIERMTKQSIPRSTVSGMEPKRSLDSNASSGRSSRSGSGGGKSGGRRPSSGGSYASSSSSRSRSGGSEGGYSSSRPRSGGSEGYSSRPRSGGSEGYSSRPRSGGSEGYSSRPRSGDSEGYRPRSGGSEGGYASSRPKRPGGSSEGYSARPRSGGSSEGYSARPRSGGSSEGYSARPRSGGSSEGYSARPRSGGSSEGYSARPRSGNSSEGYSARPRSGGSEGYSARPRTGGSEGYAARPRTGAGKPAYGKTSAGPRNMIARKPRRNTDD